ncbi:Protein LURP-one-related 7 [Linum perenne]
MDGNDSPPVAANAGASQIPVDLFVSKKHPGVPPGNLGFADSSGDVLFRVARLPSPKAWKSTWSKKLILNSSGSPLISLHRLDRGSWEGFKGGEDAEKEMIFRVQRTANKLCRAEFEVFLAGESSQDQSKPDFKVKGCCFQRSCTIYGGDSIVGQTSLMYKLHQVHASRNKFRLTVFPGSIDHALVVALVVVFLS